MQRERDKYKLYNENIVLPFDSPELLPLVDKNIETFVSMRLRKIPIHNFLVLRYGSIFSKQRTLPFEVR